VSTLDRAVLVLNRNWLAVNVATVRRAVVLLYTGSARVVATDDYSAHDFVSWLDYSRDADGDCIRTPSLKIKIPEVIILNSYTGTPAGYRGPTRATLFARDNFTCQYCGRRLPPSQLTIDHVIPRSLGGTDDWTNLLTACNDCNARKGGRTPRGAGMRLRRKPRRPLPAPFCKVRTIRNAPESWRRFLSGLPIPSSNGTDESE